MTTSTAMRPLREGMLELPDTMEGTPRLYGQRCGACGELFVGTSRAYCANCSSEQLERVTLGTSGTVHTYTVVHQAPRGSLIEAPYVIARVKLPEGVTVQTVLTDVDPKDVRIDMPVEICLKQLKEDDDGTPVVNFFFRPTSG